MTPYYSIAYYSIFVKQNFIAFQGFWMLIYSNTLLKSTRNLFMKDIIIYRAITEESLDVSIKNFIFY